MLIFDIVSKVFPDFEITNVTFFFVLFFSKFTSEKLSMNSNFLNFGSKKLYTAFAPRIEPPMPINLKLLKFLNFNKN